MCARYTMLTIEEVREVVTAVERGEVLRRLVAGTPPAQAFPGSRVPAISGQPGALRVDEPLWGFEVEWSKQPVFNTRIESALGGSALWREAMETGRCIVPAAAFFEPHRSEKAISPRTGKPVKRPYAFESPDGEALLMAGVQAHGRCSVVTCEPNAHVAPVHPRMPLLLHAHEAPIWLEGNAADLAGLADRSTLQLSARAELDAAAPTHSPEQLSLF